MEENPKKMLKLFRILDGLIDSPVIANDIMDSMIECYEDILRTLVNESGRDEIVLATRFIRTVIKNSDPTKAYQFIGYLCYAFSLNHLSYNTTPVIEIVITSFDIFNNDIQDSLSRDIFNYIILGVTGNVAIDPRRFKSSIMTSTDFTAFFQVLYKNVYLRDQFGLYLVKNCETFIQYVKTDDCTEVFAQLCYEIGAGPNIEIIYKNIMSVRNSMRLKILVAYLEKFSPDSNDIRNIVYSSIGDALSYADYKDYSLLFKFISRFFQNQLEYRRPLLEHGIKVIDAKINEYSNFPGTIFNTLMGELQEIRQICLSADSIFLEKDKQLKNLNLHDNGNMLYENITFLGNIVKTYQSFVVVRLYQNNNLKLFEIKEV